MFKKGYLIPKIAVFDVSGFFLFFFSFKGVTVMNLEHAIESLFEFVVTGIFFFAAYKNGITGRQGL